MRIITASNKRSRVSRRKKTCLFVTSCQSPMGLGRRRICLDTWLSRIDNQYFDWYFVVGDPNLSTEWVFGNGTMICRAADDWLNLVFKTKMFCKYAYEHGYDYVVKADDDTYVNTEHLKSRIEGLMRNNSFDVLAYMLPLEGTQAASSNWFPAGPLYVFSRNAVRLVAEEMEPRPENEDICLGKFLCQRNDIRALHDPWLSNLIPPEAQTAGWEPQRVGGHFKNMLLMYEVQRQLYGG